MLHFTDYFFTFSVKPQPLNALRLLDEKTKDRITPIVLLAPWLSTDPLTNTLNKFEEAFPNRPYFVDIDRRHDSISKSNTANLEHKMLVSEPTLLVDTLEPYKNAYPCFNLTDHTEHSIGRIIETRRMTGRPFALKLEFLDDFNRVPEWIFECISSDLLNDKKDWIFVLEYGWMPDALFAQNHLSQLLTRLMPFLKPTIPVVVSCTTFPEDFRPFKVAPKGGGPKTRKLSEVEALDPSLLEPAVLQFNNRMLISSLAQEFNHPKLIYGDWGSTRPRREGMGSTPKNRIDYPLDNHWVIARFQTINVDFERAAKIISTSSYWDGALGCWGEKLIEASAQGVPAAISTMPQMNTARINIHLHRQANFETLPRGDELDEIWED